MASRTWGDLTPSQRTMVATAAAVEVVLTTVALVDIAKRPPGGVRGPKALWAAGCLVQPVGPVAYFAFGRR